MKKTLPNYKINHLLLQLLVITMISVVSLVDVYMSVELFFVKVTIRSLTILLVIIFEILIALYYNRAKKEFHSGEDQDNIIIIHRNEKFLWVELLLLINLMCLPQIVSQVLKRFGVDMNVGLYLAIGFVLFIVITMFLRPLFGIRTKK